jgi:predicted AAA+ superfamily ATPase
MEYQPRVIDGELQQRLKRSGAVLISGPKGCGKTESARQLAKSEIRIDIDLRVPDAMQIDPGLLLRGDTPRLLDEWQEQPVLWNHVRREVDDRQAKGQFILTGSANPVEDVKMHSGAARISKLSMRPMSLWESGYSSGEVSLKDIVAGAHPTSKMCEHTLQDIIWNIIVGGWPTHIGKDFADAALDNADYVSLLADVDISRVSKRKRDPIKVRNLLKSYARNIAIPATVSTLAKDVIGDEDSIARATVNDYIETLTRLMIIEDLPAWNAHLRSKAELRTTPKRHFIDPSLAVAALGADLDALLNDVIFLGYLFESEVLRDLRIYSQPLRATVAHYKGSKRRESDIILQFPDSSWAAFEVKLGSKGADEGAKSLLRVASEIDTERTGKQLALTVITGFGFAHRRPDGVNVVPLATLRP